MASLNLSFIFFCQAVDLNHPTQATAVKWIEAFARHPRVKQIVVLPLRVGEFSLPDNVTVIPVQQRNRLLTVVTLYRKVIQMLISGKIDFFWINQGGPYPLLLLPFKVFLKKPIYQWKAHPYLSLSMRLYARYCDTKIFTCTAHSFPLALAKRHIVGHGIDVDEFRIDSTIPKTETFVTTGRIMPSKHLDIMLRVLAACKHQYGHIYRLDIYGSEERTDHAYKRMLEALVEELGLTEQVSFKGMVRHAELPGILNAARLFLNFSETALDKAVVEAMACGVPVISSNPCVADILPPELRQLSIVPQDNINRIAEAIQVVLSLNEAESLKMGNILREIVVRHHSVEGLIDKILTEIGGSLC